MDTTAAGSAGGRPRPFSGLARARTFPRSLAALRQRFSLDTWVPSCAHSTMAVIYQDKFECMNCGRESPSGMLYRCIVDKEPLILDAKDRGVPVAFDDIGSQLAEEMTLGKFGADARSDALNVITEMTAEQLASYTPEQLSILISQRKNVHQAIANERLLFGHRTPQSAREKYPHDDKPWLPDRSRECQHKVCPACYRIGRQKSWVSLDAVLNGEILPHVATAFSFSFMGTRPVAHANVVSNLGCRPIPLPQYHPAMAREPEQLTSTTFNLDMGAQASPYGSLNGMSAPTLPPHARSNTSISPPGIAASAVQGTNSLVATPRSMASQPKEIYAPDFFMEYEYSEYTLACCTPLPLADPDEACSLAELGIAAGATVGEGDHFPPELLDVGHGIALTEEAVESGTADLVPAAPRLDASV